MRLIKITIKPKECRLDKFLAKTAKNLTRSQAKKLIKEGNIVVNAHIVEPDYEVKKGDLVRLEIPQPKPAQVKAEDIALNIVYEDDSLLVIDKESGMVVHPTVDHPNGTVVNALLFHLKRRTKGLGESLRPGIVHRLDKGTSGLLVIAKSGKALESLKAQFKKRDVTKKYLALASKKIEPLFGRIEKPIARHPKNRKKFTVSDAGREAVTDYFSIEQIGPYTLLELEPKTGRTHQIRVHLSSIGCPIVGDRLYGGKAAPRLFLHASYLEFTHPKTKKRVSFRSGLPVDLEGILNKIRSSTKK